MPKFLDYDDGLDADGYPLDDQPKGFRYNRGSEAEAGDWQPTTLFDAFQKETAIINEFGGLFESPIERTLGLCLLKTFRGLGLPFPVIMPGTDIPDDTCVLIPQFKWGVYRSDFAIIGPRRWQKLLIECDGRDFHSSPDQVAHDERKDALARGFRYHTIRFSGAEIHRDAYGGVSARFSIWFFAT